MRARGGAASSRSGAEARGGAGRLRGGAGAEPSQLEGRVQRGPPASFTALALTDARWRTVRN